MLKDKSVENFTDELASNKPTPSGGSTAALVGAFSAALGEMVVSLTVGKKKYADTQSEAIQIRKELEVVREKMIELMQADTEVLLPLTDAYKIPASDPKKDDVMAQVLRDAAEIPLKLMEECQIASYLIERLSFIGSALAISDAGCAAALAEGAAKSAILNVKINTAAMKDKEIATSINTRAEEMLCDITDTCKKAYNLVYTRF